MTTTFLYQIQDRAMSYEIFTAFKTVYPDAEYNHIKNTITVEMTVDSNPPFMESLYKGIREEYYRWQSMSDTERDHFTELGQSYPTDVLAATPGQVQEPRIAADYHPQNYMPYLDWLADSTAADAENERDTDRLTKEMRVKVWETRRKDEKQLYENENTMIATQLEAREPDPEDRAEEDEEPSDEEIYWQLQDLLSE